MEASSGSSCPPSAAIRWDRRKFGGGRARAVFSPLYLTRGGCVAWIVIPAAPASDSPPIPKGREVRFSDCGVSMRRFGGTQMSAAVKITHTDETPVTLRALAAKSRDTAQSRRLLAIAMVLEGSSRLEAARQTGMDRQTLRDWVHRFNEVGVAGLLSRRPPGPT